MAEAEQVLTDVARHATVFVRDLWRRYRPAPEGPRSIQLVDVVRRVDLLVASVFADVHPIRVAQTPAPPTLLSRLFRGHAGPSRRHAVPSTDGVALWLPGDSGTPESRVALDRYRATALMQAARARRGTARFGVHASSPLVRDVYLLLEARAADAELANVLPGMSNLLAALRLDALAQRPPLDAFPAAVLPLERFVRRLLDGDSGDAIPLLPSPTGSTPSQSLEQAERIARELVPDARAARRLGPEPLWKDWWTGELRPPAADASVGREGSDGAASEEDDESSTRSARLKRRPQVREAEEDEDDGEPGAWMVQQDDPHEVAEDPHGLQRPTDRDTETAPESFAESVEELAEARLVSTPGRPKEFLLSDDPPETRAPKQPSVASDEKRGVAYPEWDFRAGAYRHPGAIVHVVPAPLGDAKWVERFLTERRAMLTAVRRRFEDLRAQRLRLGRQLDGEDIDLAAVVEARADLRAGQPMSQALYATTRTVRRDLAVMLLVDVSGSTDGWISGNRRVIDVEREALLPVCVALDALGAAYSVQAFSGEGPKGVVVQSVKHFRERYGKDVARRIAALEPEHYTRAGAAFRHATALLMQEPARQRLLILLSDGKPNDVDEYEGRYGVEDLRQSVTEAKLQGIHPFCLTVDRQGAEYLPYVFGARQYALLQQVERLPTVLLEWLRRLVAT